MWWNSHAACPVNKIRKQWRASDKWEWFFALVQNSSEQMLASWLWKTPSKNVTSPDCFIVTFLFLGGDTPQHFNVAWSAWSEQRHEETRLVLRTNPLQPVMTRPFGCRESFTFYLPFNILSEPWHRQHFNDIPAVLSVLCDITQLDWLQCIVRWYLVRDPWLPGMPMWRSLRVCPVKGKQL